MNRTQEALDYIVDCCPNIGAFSGTSDVYKYIKCVAIEVGSSRASLLFPERYKEHVAYALMMVAESRFLDPPAAVASVYLVSRFEYYFRVLSGKLNSDGTWIDSDAQSVAMSAIGNDKLRRKYLSSVSLAYKVMKVNRQSKVAQAFCELDSNVFATPCHVAGGRKLCDVGDRIEFCRHRAAHGEWGDISSEAVFYGLVTAIVFYNQL